MIPENNSETNHRHIRSYVRREGRLTKGQQRALEALWPLYGLNVDPRNLIEQNHIDLPKVFGRAAPVTLEIGFGDGGALLEMAKQHPEHDFIGIEVHRPGIGHLLIGIEESELTNIRVLSEDAVTVLKVLIPDSSLDCLQIFFPDPWHKKRHNKRRIVNKKFINVVANKLKRGGVFHFATDWEPYAIEALERIEQSLFFRNRAGNKNFSPRPSSRPETKFERRGHRLGHCVWDILMEKV